MAVLSVVIPIFNEEQCLKEMYRRVSEVLKALGKTYELIFVNDGSTDESSMILNTIQGNDENVKIINLSRNFGHQAAITAGMNCAEGDALITMDGDLQDPPEVMPEMVDKWQEGFDIVYAKHIKRKGESIFKKVTAKVFYRLLHCLSDIDMPLDCGDFRLLDKKVYMELNKFEERNRYLRGLIAWTGFRCTYVSYIRDERYAGSTKYPLHKMMKLAKDGVFSFSAKPLRIARYIGAFVCLAGFAGIIWAICQKLMGFTVQGWASTLAAVCLLSGANLFILGIIGEYIARIYEETKNRPLYIVRDKIGFTSKDNNSKT